jgi:hypothetical protein
MSEIGADLVRMQHEEAVRREREEKERAREEVTAMCRAALDRERVQKNEMKALVERVHRETVESNPVGASPPGERPRGVHYTELPEAEPGSVLAAEWNTYRREVGRWLAEGLEGRHVLIKGESVIGMYATDEEARAAGYQRYLLQPFFAHEIRTEEPYLRIRGVNYPCRNSPSL